MDGISLVRTVIQRSQFDISVLGEPSELDVGISGTLDLPENVTEVQNALCFSSVEVRTKTGELFAMMHIINFFELVPEITSKETHDDLISEIKKQSVEAAREKLHFFVDFHTAGGLKLSPAKTELDPEHENGLHHS